MAPKRSSSRKKQRKTLVKSPGVRNRSKKQRFRQSKKGARKSSSFSPVPVEFGTVTPYLVVNGASGAIDFYKRAFDAKELARETTPDGKVLHGRIRIGDSIVLVSDEFPGTESKAPTTIGTTTVTLHIYAKDVNKLWNTALQAGARIAMNLDNMFWGERYGQLVDPFGHRWSVSMRIRMDPREMEEKRKAAMEMFSRLPPKENPSPEPQLADLEKTAAAGVG